MLIDRCKTRSIDRLDDFYKAAGKMDRCLDSSMPIEGMPSSKKIRIWVMIARPDKEPLLRRRFEHGPEYRFNALIAVVNC